jgi:hypothetical protein
MAKTIMTKTISKSAMIRLTIVTAIFAAAFALDAPASYAFGHAPWCAVVNNGGPIVWNCYYRSIEECTPNVLGGNRGFCNLNPALAQYPRAPRGYPRAPEPWQQEPWRW